MTRSPARPSSRVFDCGGLEDPARNRVRGIWWWTHYSVSRLLQQLWGLWSVEFVSGPGEAWWANIWERRGEARRGLFTRPRAVYRLSVPIYSSPNESWSNVRSNISFLVISIILGCLIYLTVGFYI